MLNLLKPLLPSPPPDLLLPPPPPLPPAQDLPPAFQIRPSCQICPDLSSRSPVPQNLPPTSFAHGQFGHLQGFSEWLKASRPGRDASWQGLGTQTYPWRPSSPRPLYPRPPFQKKNVSFKTFRSKVIGTQTLYNFYKAFHTDPTAQGLGGARKDLGWRALEGL